MPLRPIVPTVVGLVLCKSYHAETRSMQFCFNRCSVDASVTFPLPLNLVACAILTSGQGEVEFELIVNRLATDEVIHSVAWRAELDPTSYYRCVQSIQCDFPAPGAYDVVVSAINSATQERSPIAQAKFEIVNC